jgi:1-acyl-sn-glycerol-3-phosphate acyltransferase
MFLRWVLFHVLLLGLALASLGWNLLAWLLKGLLRRETSIWLGRRVIARGYQTFWDCAQGLGLMQLDTSCLNALRDEPGLIIAANHPSMMDAMLVVGRLPRSFCIMKSSLLRNPFLAAGAQLAAYVPNDTPFQVIHAAVRALREGGQLVVFPEGTRNQAPRLLPFLSGFASIACHAKVPIQTVFIHTDSPYLSKGWPIWKRPPFPVRCTLRLGQRFEPEGSYTELRQRVEGYFQAHAATFSRLP